MMTSDLSNQTALLTQSDVETSPRSTEDATITFYVMADAPYTDYEWDEVLPNVMEALSLMQNCCPLG
jgi:hypothetical protein